MHKIIDKIEFSVMMKAPRFWIEPANLVRSARSCVDFTHINLWYTGPVKSSMFQKTRRESYESKTGAEVVASLRAAEQNGAIVWDDGVFGKCVVPSLDGGALVVDPHSTSEAKLENIKWEELAVELDKGAMVLFLQRKPSALKFK